MCILLSTLLRKVEKKIRDDLSEKPNYCELHFTNIQYLGIFLQSNPYMFFRKKRQKCNPNIASIIDFLSICFLSRFLLDLTVKTVRFRNDIGLVFGSDCVWSWLCHNLLYSLVLSQMTDVPDNRTSQMAEFKQTEEVSK